MRYMNVRLIKGRYTIFDDEGDEDNEKEGGGEDDLGAPEYLLCSFTLPSPPSFSSFPLPLPLPFFPLLLFTYFFDTL